MFDDAKQFFKKINNKNKTAKLEGIQNFSYQDIHGNTIIDAAIEGIADPDLLVEVVDHLMKNGAAPDLENRTGKYGNAIQRASYLNKSKLLEFFYAKNPAWFDIIHERYGQNLAVLAIMNRASDSLKTLLELKPSLVNEKMKAPFEGFTPLQFCLVQQKLLLEKFQDSKDDNLRNILNQANNPTTDLIGKELKKHAFKKYDL